MKTSDLGNNIIAVKYNLVFFGDIGVGQAPVMNKFIKDQFSEE